MADAQLDEGRRTQENAEVDGLVRCMVQMLVTSKRTPQSMEGLVARAVRAVPRDVGFDNIELRKAGEELKLVLARLGAWYTGNPWS